MSDTPGPEPRTRRPAPPFRRATVVGTEAITPRLTRVTIEGEALVGFPMPEPAGSVRLLLPEPDAFELPAPYARVVVRYGNPLLVGADADRAMVEARRQDNGQRGSPASAADDGQPAAHDRLALNENTFSLPARMRSILPRWR